ncbi:hypothetical protein AAMO2058_000998200 [Amorphochlora amoebiformis]
MNKNASVRIFTRSASANRPRYQSMSITKLEEELRAHQGLLRELGPRLSDKGAKLEYTIEVIEAEIHRAKTEMNDLSASLKALGLPRGQPEPVLIPEMGSISRDEKGNEIRDMSTLLEKEYRAKVEEFEKAPPTKFRRRPPMPRVSFREAARIREEERKFEQRARHRPNPNLNPRHHLSLNLNSKVLFANSNRSITTVVMLTVIVSECQASKLLYISRESLIDVKHHSPREVSSPLPPAPQLAGMDLVDRKVSSPQTDSTHVDSPVTASEGLPSDSDTIGLDRRKT